MSGAPQLIGIPFAKLRSIGRMRSIAKKAVMWAYCRGLLSVSATTWLFNVLRLRTA